MIYRKELVVFFKLVLITLGLALEQHVALGAPTAGEDFRKKLDEICSSLSDKANIGLAVYSVDKSCFLYERNADQMYATASSIKAISGIAALVDMGGDYTFKTTLYGIASEWSANQLDNQFVSHLYLNLTGDPSLKTQDLDGLFKGLKEKGITTIKGNIYVQYTPWKMLPVNKTWMLEDIEETYGAPVATVILDKNVFTDMVEGVKTDKKQAVLKPVKDAEFNFTSKLKRIFQDRGIDLQGEIVYGPFAIQDLVVVKEHDSAPLRSLLSISLKESDNLYADALFLRMATRRNKNVESWSEASEVLKKVFQTRLGVDLQDISIEDGSGISRMNLVSPRKFVQVLASAVKHSSLIKDLSTALAGGTEGTLKYRLADPVIQKRIRAKTGSMRSVSTLVGYAKSADGETLAFAILTNNFFGSSHPYKRLEEKLCYAICGLEMPAKR